MVATSLVTVSTQNSFEILAVRHPARTNQHGPQPWCLTLLDRKSEPALRMVATLVGQFRLWFVD